MGRKVHPRGFRLGRVQNWRARWYADGPEYRELLAEDLAIRDAVRSEMERAGISKIDIERSPNQVSLTIHSARPGIIIGRKGANVNALREHLQGMTGKSIRIEVQEIEHPEVDARLVAENLAYQLSRRIYHRRAMKQAVGRAMRLGVEGIKIVVAGRLGGYDMARRERLMEGRVPLHTIRADIDFAQAEALTRQGQIGIKVWIYNGEVLPEAAVPATDATTTE
ncbi:MAG: 30S ribosomal protein S3 [Anaerolineae bacterium]